MEPGSAIPVLRFFDLRRTLDFYTGWLGMALDWQDGDGEGPTSLQVSCGRLVLQLSSHHDDGTPGSVVLVPTRGVAGLHASLAPYPFMRPGLEAGPLGRDEVTVIDPASNRIRFWEAPADGEA
jgi:catechol 2,3-dioxygenase-like lactoylglutathione lyase family enzyme